jgi:hypothetical protein
VPDSFRQRYGVRLKGGGKKGSERSVKDIFGSRAEALTMNTDPVDPDKLDIGDNFSCVYARGARAGERRTATLKHKKEISRNA